MNNTIRNSSKKSNNFLRDLTKAINDLPTESEKKEMQDHLTAVIEYFSELRKLADLLPTIENTGRVQEALARLDELSIKAKTNPSLAGLLGARARTRKQIQKAPLTNEESGRAKGILSELEALSEDDLRLRVRDENRYSIRTLQTIAALLGNRSSQKLSRESLADLIATKIINYKSYKMLRGNVEEENRTDKQ
jgi:hypothetical protein